MGYKVVEKSDWELEGEVGITAEKLQSKKSQLLFPNSTF
jgi:hypothetical protein